MSLTESKATQKSSGNANTLESLLKEVYRMHKEVVKSSSNVWRDKFIKMRKIKTNILESKKSLQKEIDVLKEENKSLKEAQKSYILESKESLQKEIDALKEENESLKEAQKSYSSTKLSLDNEKHNRLRMKSLQKKVVYTQEEFNKFFQPIDNNNCSIQEYGKNFVPDSEDVPTVIKETLEEVPWLSEETMCPQTLVFNCSSESDCDSGDNKNKDLDHQKLYTFGSPNLAKNTDIKINNFCQTNLEEGGLEFSPKQEATRPVSSIFTSNKTLVSSKTSAISPVLIDSPTIDVSLGPNNIEENQTEADSLTNSPKLKKRRMLTNLTQFQKNSQNVLKVDLLKKPSWLMHHSKNIISSSKGQSCKPIKKSKMKQKIYISENCSPNRFALPDLDKTEPPENWNNTTVMQPSETNSMLTENPSEHSGDKNWSRNNGRRVGKTKELVTDSLHNGSLAPSMCMTEFLLENEDSTNSKPAEMASKKSSSTKVRNIEEPLIIVPSDSYKFEDGKPEVMLIKDKMKRVSKENNKDWKLLNTQDNNCSITDSFDRCPWKEDHPYAYDTVVRKKHDRKLLNGYACQECVEYYRAKNLSDEEISKQIGDCSKHRAKYKPPNTPQHFWSVGFPDTQECEKRGYFTTENKLLKGKKHEKETDSKKENNEYRMTQLLDYLDYGSEEVED